MFNQSQKDMKKKEAKTIFKEIMTKNVLEQVKDTNQD